MENRTTPSLLRSLFLSLAITFVSVSAALTLLPLLLLVSPDPSKLATPAAYGTLAAGAFLCGILCARFHRSRGLVSGAVAGAVYVLIVLTVGCVTFGLQRPVAALGVSAGMVVLSAAAGIIGLPRGKKRRFMGRR